MPYLYGAWVMALVALLGSLFLGEVMKLPPCVLCWYQRICLYPLVPLLAAGIILRDRNLIWYVGPLMTIGLGFSLYHNLLYYHLIPETLSLCTAQLSCVTRQIEWFGFLNIPLLGLMAFTFIAICLVLHERRNRFIRI